jgi:hypothetical protein
LILVGQNPRGLVTLIRKRGQRWHRLACFGPKSHYYADGGCDHTDAVMAGLNPYGKKVTKLEPFGNGKFVPKRFRPEKHRHRAPVTEILGEERS